MALSGFAASEDAAGDTVSVVPADAVCAESLPFAGDDKHPAASRKQITRQKTNAAAVARFMNM